MVKEKKPINTEFQNARFLVTKYLKPKDINYAREIKIAKELLKNYSSVKFWENYNLGFFLNSLAFFLGEGAKELNKQYRISDLNIPENINYIEQNNQIPIQFPPISKKINTIKEFLK